MHRGRPPKMPRGRPLQLLQLVLCKRVRRAASHLAIKHCWIPCITMSLTDSISASAGNVGSVPAVFAISYASNSRTTPGRGASRGVTVILKSPCSTPCTRCAIAYIAKSSRRLRFQHSWVLYHACIVAGGCVDSERWNA